MINYVGKENNKTNEFKIEDGFIGWAVDYHKTLPEFKKRPITTFFIEESLSLFSLRIGVAFVLVNFLATFICGFLVYYLGRQLQLTHTKALMSVSFFYSSFSVLLAYFIPIATYDEPLQYLFILLALILFQQKKYWWFSIAFSLAVIARESSLILLPAIVLFLGVPATDFFNKKKEALLKIIAVGIPVFLYIVFLFWFYDKNPDYISKTEEVMGKKLYHYEKNFRNLENVIRTLLSISSVLLLPIFLVVRYQMKHKYLNSNLIKSFWLTLVINTTTILIASYAEESRLFALPLLMIFPLMGELIALETSSLNNLKSFLFNPIRIGSLLIISIGSWLLFDILYQFTDINCNENLFREYNAIMITCIVALVQYSKYKKGLNQNSSNTW